jgi:putative spermidine/putrescine transport system substrate-binding protein
LIRSEDARLKGDLAMKSAYRTLQQPARRKFIRQTSAVAVASFGAPYIWAQGKTDDTLVVNSFGGEYQELVEKAVIAPFEKKFGVKVVHDTTGTSSQDYAKIRASKGAPGFDVAAALSPPEVVLGAKENLLEKLTEKEVPNIKYTWEKARAALPPVAAIHTLQFDSLLYNKDKLDKPASWADYWQPEKRYGAKIKGHVINYNPANLLSVYALIHAAELSGGSATNMDPAWAILKAQKPMVGVVVTTSAEAAPHFESGEVWISPYWSARAGYYISRGIPYGMVVPKEGVIANIDASAVPVGAKNKKLAYEFINFQLDPATQRAWCLAYFCSPGRGDITDWPKAFADTQIVTAQQFASVRLPDLEAIGNNRKDWTLKWQEIMG